jgi:hypothetical protein
MVALLGGCSMSSSRNDLDSCVENMSEIYRDLCYISYGNVRGGKTNDMTFSLKDINAYGKERGLRRIGKCPAGGEYAIRCTVHPSGGASLYVECSVHGTRGEAEKASREEAK